MERQVGCRPILGRKGLKKPDIPDPEYFVSCNWSVDIILRHDTKRTSYITRSSTWLHRPQAETKFLINTHPNVCSYLLKLLNSWRLLVALQKLDFGQTFHFFNLPCNDAIVGQSRFWNISLL